MRMKWVCPIYGGGRGCSAVHVYISEWVCPHVLEGEWLALQRGGRRWSLISSQHRQHVHSTGGDKQVLNVHTCTRARTGTYIHTHMDGHTYTHGDCLQHIVIPMSMHAHADTHTHKHIDT